MKFAVALLIATVAATEAATTDAAKKTGAASGEACDGNAAAKGCADGLRCHLGKTASNAAAAAKPKTKASCKEAKLGDFIGYTAYNVMHASTPALLRLTSRLMHLPLKHQT